MPSKSHEDKEWPISLIRARAGNEDDILAVALEALDHYDNNPIDDSEFLADKTKRYLQEIWSQWLRFAERIKAHPEDTWLALCTGSEDAKARCRAFLESYVRTSMVKRPCLGAEEWQEVRTVNCAVTLEDVWAALVRNADEYVLKRKRGEDRERAHLWSLHYSSRDKGFRSSPAYEIGQWIPQLAMKLGLTLKQLFTKRETPPENIILILSTLWSRAEDIRCSPSTRVAFDCSIILGGIGGWRPKSVVAIKYEQVQFAWGQVSITTVPCRQLCLLTFWVSRALADNAFEAGFTASSQVFRAEPLEPGIDYVPLLWKADMKDKCIHSISYNTYWSIWNRALFVSGLRDEDAMRPYAMRVGGGGRLDGSLIAPLRNFILSNSTEVYEHSYLPIHLNKDLMKVAYRDKAGQNEEMVSMMSRAFLRRDPYAPIYITEDDFASFEKRNDLSSLRKQYREAKDDPVKAQRIKARIKYLLDWLERLRIQQVRKEYFAEVDRLRAQGITTHHLRTTQATNPRKQREVVGSSVAKRVLCDKSKTPDLFKLKDFWTLYKDQSIGRLGNQANVISLLARAKQFNAGYKRRTGSEIGEETVGEINHWLKRVPPYEAGSGVQNITKPKYNYKPADLDRKLETLLLRKDLGFVHPRIQFQFHFILLGFCHNGARKNALLQPGVKYEDVQLALHRTPKGDPEFFFKLDQQHFKNKETQIIRNLVSPVESITCFATTRSSSCYSLPSPTALWTVNFSSR
ncbi:hypothetical protein VFPBJ_11588 [Purpureocillium lilacinum]|uniref:Uncharacterized protein n=1 Tax=Purpureocillium lilacinum TaxID=33203 RepID=A0A179F2X8_PURLI|nr:hypothetical protein VFPBJ_11588 [Purpureocillium lilacinum]